MFVVPIDSSAQFETLLKSSTVVVADFYADWCGPCKQIAPIYQELASKFSKPRAMTFTKVNVDDQRDISQKYGVRAMPTFMIFRNGSLNKTIKGADRRGLTDAITEAAKSATASSAFSGAGHTLGGTPLGSKPAAAAGVTTPRLPMNWSFRGIIDAVINFIGMFLVSLFSLNGKKAAEDSRFNAQNQASRAGSSVPLQSGGRKVGEGPATLAKPPQKKFATLSDLNGS